MFTAELVIIPSRPKIRLMIAIIKRWRGRTYLVSAIKPATGGHCHIMRDKIRHLNLRLENTMQRPMFVPKIIVVMFVGALLIPMFSYAQPPRDGKGRAEQMTNRLKDSLQLSTEQAKKVRAIYDSMQVRMATDREANGGDRDAMMQAMRIRMEKADKEIEALLSPDQKKKFEVFQKDREQRMRQRMQERRDNQ